MKPINAEETVRVFNGWLEEADSLAEREAIERCIDHIQDAPAVSQQELRSYMLPWFSPFAAPWCGKIQRAFPKAYVTMNFELILVPRTNTYINLNHCSTPDEFKAEVIEGVSRFAFKAFTKPLCKEHLDGINKLLDTKFTPEDMEYIYTNLGNGINHELCIHKHRNRVLGAALCWFERTRGQPVRHCTPAACRPERSRRAAHRQLYHAERQDWHRPASAARPLV